MFRTTALRAALISLLTGLALGLSACVATDPQADKTARAAYAHLAKGEDDQLISMMDPSERGPDTAANLKLVHTLVPPGPPPEGKQTAWSSYAGTSGASTTLTHEYSYPDRDVIMTTTMTKSGNPPKWVVKGFNVNVRMKTAPADAAKKPAA
jgi:hypothetical protein